MFGWGRQNNNRLGDSILANPVASLARDVILKLDSLLDGRKSAFNTDAVEALVNARDLIRSRRLETATPASNS